MWTLADAEVENIDSMAHWLHDCSDVSWTCDQLREHINHPRYQLRVIKQSKEQALVAGFYLVNCIADECTLMIVAVGSNWRRQGLALKMMDDLILRAKSRGEKVILLEVRESNQQALALYQQLGFCEQGRRKGYYPAESDSSERETAIVMSLALN